MQVDRQRRVRSVRRGIEDDLFYQRANDLRRFVPVFFIGQRFVEPRDFAPVMLRHFGVQQRRRLIRRRDQRFLGSISPTGG